MTVKALLPFKVVLRVEVGELVRGEVFGIGTKIGCGLLLIDDGIVVKIGRDDPPAANVEETF